MEKMGINQSIENKKAQKIMKKCLQQNEDFKRWYDKKSWGTFHHSHYDWWAFPINQRSSYGEQYKVSHSQIQVMKKSENFINALRTNAIMVCQAWGYDLKSGDLIKTEDEDQKWHNWPIRLSKMTKSLELFEINDLFRNAIKYGNMLIDQGKKFEYNRRDLAQYFKKNKNLEKIKISKESEEIKKIDKQS